MVLSRKTSSKRAAAAGRAIAAMRRAVSLMRSMRRIVSRSKDGYGENEREMHPDTFWIIGVIRNAPRCILAHPDDPSDHRGAIPDHRDAILDARKPSSDPRKGLRPDLERRKRAP